MGATHRNVLGIGWLLALLSACGTAVESPEDPPYVSTPGPLSLSASWQGGTADDDHVTDLVVEPGGATYVGGFEGAQWNVDRYVVGGAARGVVQRLREDGTLEWRRELVTPGRAVDLTGLSLDREEGGVLVTGRTTGAFPGFQNAGQMDAYATRFDPDGTPGFLHQWGDERPEQPRRIERWGDRFFVAGFHDTFVPMNYVERWEDPFLDGLTLGLGGLSRDWQQRFDSAGSDVAWGLAVGADGTSYVVGSQASGPLKGPFLVAYAPGGEQQWRVRFTNVSFDNAAAVRIAPDGNVVVAGSTWTNFLGHANAGEMDVFVVKVDVATAQPLWSALIGGPGGEWVTSLDLDAKGNAWIGGETTGAFVKGQEVLGGSDGFALGVSNIGEEVQRFQFGSAGEDSVTAVRGRGLGAVVGGWTTGDLFGPNQGGHDGFVTTIRLDGAP